MDDAVGAQVADDWATPVLPERGLAFSETKYLQMQLCKPKLLPIKSYSLQKLERMEKKMAQEAKEKRDSDRQQRKASVGWTSPDLRDDRAAAHPATTTPVTTPSTTAASPSTPVPMSAKMMMPTSAGTVMLTSPLSADGSPTPSVKVAASSTSGTGMVLTEEEADAPMTPPDRSSSNPSASDVSALSASTPEYD